MDDDVPSVIYELQLVYFQLLICCYTLLKIKKKNDTNNMFRYPSTICTYAGLTVPKPFCFRRLIETNTKSSSPVTAPTIVPSLNHNVQPPSDPIIASVLHPRQNARPGRLLLENVNNRPQTMDRGTQANTDDVQDDVSDRHSVTVITEAPSTSHNDPVMNDLVSIR